MSWSIDLTTIIIFLLTTLFGLITTKVVPWIKSNTSLKQQELLDLVIKAAVQAAEQLYKSSEGEKKKQYVLDYLNQHHLKVDETLIEAKVNELFGKHLEGSITTNAG